MAYSVGKKTKFSSRLLLGVSKLSRLMEKHESLVFEMYELKKYACRVALLNCANRKPIFYRLFLL